MELDITKLLEEHMGIIHYIANRYRNIDEHDELVSWGYIGFMNAYHEWKKRPDLTLANLMFGQIKKVIFAEYFKKDRGTDSELTLDTPMEGKDGDEGDTMITRVIDGGLHYTAKDIEQMVYEALFELEEREMVMDYFLQDEDITSLSKKYSVPKHVIRKRTNQGFYLLKQYLINNNLISEWLFAVDDNNKRSWKPIILSDETQRQLKYLRTTYPSLNTNDYAKILNQEVSAINYTLAYPTTTYIRLGLDDSIKDKAESYINTRYPYMLASEVEELVMV